FSGCDMSNASLSSSTLKSISLSDNKFINTNFFRTNLKGVDFSSCELVNPIVSDTLSELKGILINPHQAMNIVGLLDIKIK
ncbi:MAG: pentapeptide repeat-containing protein, partial [Clostridium sp.]